MRQSVGVGPVSSRGSGGWKLRGTLDGGARQASDGPYKAGGFG